MKTLFSFSLSAVLAVFGVIIDMSRGVNVSTLTTMGIDTDGLFNTIFTVR